MTTATEETLRVSYRVTGLTNDIAGQMVGSIRRTDPHLAEANWTDVKSKIEESFRRLADRTRPIVVGAKSASLKRTGSVASWAERDQAVWCIPKPIPRAPDPNLPMVDNDLEFVF